MTENTMRGYAVRTHRPLKRFRNLALNKRYAEILAMEEDGTLEEKFPKLRVAKAHVAHKAYMATKDTILYVANAEGVVSKNEVTGMPLTAEEALNLIMGGLDSDIRTILDPLSPALPKKYQDLIDEKIKRLRKPEPKLVSPGF